MLSSRDWTLKSGTLSHLLGFYKTLEISRKPIMKLKYVKFSTKTFIIRGLLHFSNFVRLLKKDGIKELNELSTQYFAKT